MYRAHAPLTCRNERADDDADLDCLLAAVRGGGCLCACFRIDFVTQRASSAPARTRTHRLNPWIVLFVAAPLAMGGAIAVPHGAPLSLVATHAATLAVGIALAWSLRALGSRAEPSAGLSPTNASPSPDTAAPDAQQLLEKLNAVDLATKIAGIGIWQWDVAHDTLTADAVIARANGLDAIDIRGGARRFFTDRVHPQDVAEFDRVLDTALAQGDSFSHRYRVKLPTTDISHVQVHCHIERDPAGAAIRMFGFTMDVTAEVRSTARLMQQAEKERLLSDRLNLATKTADIGVWETDLVTREITHDETSRRLLGSKTLLDEQSLIALTHPDDREAVFKASRRQVTASADGGVVTLRHRIQRPGEALLHLRTDLRVSKDQNGNAVRVLGVTRDVTAEVNHAEEQLLHATDMQRFLDRFGIATQAASISPWEMDLRTRQFVWDMNRLKAFGPDDLPVDQLTDASYRSSTRTIVISSSTSPMRARPRVPSVSALPGPVTRSVTFRRTHATCRMSTASTRGCSAPPGM